MDKKKYKTTIGIYEKDKQIIDTLKEEGESYALVLEQLIKFYMENCKGEEKTE